MDLLPEIGSAGLTTDEVAERLADEFAGELVDVRVQEPDTVVAKVEVGKLHDVAVRLRGLSGIDYDMLNFVAGVDRVTHLESVYHVFSYASNTYLELHVEISRAKAVCPTVTDVWPAADWHERESWDMVGITYEGHPDLRRILLKDDFIGHPLRKDYVDLAENHPNA
jgi:NADH-quinone oxidoreductase subunit C